MTKKLMQAVTVAALIAAAAPASAAQAVISHPMRMIVPYVPGGGTDTLSRIVAPFITEEFGHPVVLDNRPGGGSTIGTQIVARANPDGYTIGMIDAAFVANPSLYTKLPYDTLKDFMHVVRVATAPLVLCVHPTVQATSVKDLTALAKASPGKLTFGSAGNGTGVHIAGEQLRKAAGIDILHVPYKGAGQQVTDLLGGQITMGFMIPSVGRPHISAGKLRALALTGSKRSKALPQVITFAEAGFPSVDAATMNGIIAPAGTPRDFVQRLNGTIVRALRRQDIQDKLVELGFDVAGGTPEEFTAWLRTEIAKLSKVVKESGVKLESL